MTHLLIALYTAEGVTGAWANMEYDGHALEGVIHDAQPRPAYDTLLTLLETDIKILRPKQLKIFTNDSGLVKMFTRPIRLEVNHLPLLRGLSRYNKWGFLFVEGENLRKAKQEWLNYTNATSV